MQKLSKLLNYKLFIYPSNHHYILIPQIFDTVFYTVLIMLTSCLSKLSLMYTVYLFIIELQ